jgi:vancomycin permeability regulator SanA
MENNYDIILILAGGYNNETGEIHEWVKRRLDLAYNKFMEKNVPIICLGGGTYHKSPYINKDRFVIHESTACVNYLKDKGIPYTWLFKEWSSYDTIGNVYFSLVQHIQLMNVRHILIITSEFHMPRSKLLFDWIYGIAYQKYFLHYLEASDDELEEILEERIKREKNNILYIKNILIPKIKKMEDLHYWFHTEHKAYSTHDHNIEIIDEDCKKSY